MEGSYVLQVHQNVLFNMEALIVFNVIHLVTGNFR